jgi:hypothetical protein
MLEMSACCLGRSKRSTMRIATERRSGLHPGPVLGTYDTVTGMTALRMNLKLSRRSRRCAGLRQASPQNGDNLLSVSKGESEKASLSGRSVHRAVCFTPRPAAGTRHANAAPERWRCRREPPLRPPPEAGSDLAHITKNKGQRHVAPSTQCLQSRCRSGSDRELVSPSIHKYRNLGTSLSWESRLRVTNVVDGIRRGGTDA